MKNKIRLFLFSCGTLILAQIIWTSAFYLLINQPTKRSAPVQKKATLHVFIHGTFGSSLGLLSFFPVIHDDFKGSHYIKTTRLMRKDPFFYKDQPMLERGLVQVFPSYTFYPTEHQKVAQALIKSYADINQFSKQNNKTEHLFYTFGWTGLLSKKQRREESVRLYNRLLVEKTGLEEKGYKTKIVLIAHSHGGNLALNLAGINAARFPQKTEYVSSSQIQQSERQKMETFLTHLPPLKKQIAKKGEKQFDYKPEGPRLIIDRLYLLGTPIQPETDHYAFDQNTFKSLYNFYSENDPIQKIDWISTARYYSEQRFSLLPSAQKVSMPTHIKQVRIVFDRDQKQKQNTSSWIPSLFAQNNEELLVDEDPNHRDLWFVAHHKKEEEQSIVYPLPLFVFSPIMHQLIKQKKETDIDINISRMHRYIRLNAHPYQSNCSLGSSFFPLSDLQMIKKKILSWQPHPLIKQNEFNIIATHVKKAALKK
jgi:hypothetical protein